MTKQTDQDLYHHHQLLLLSMDRAEEEMEQAWAEPQAPSLSGSCGLSSTSGRPWPNGSRTSTTTASSGISKSSNAEIDSGLTHPRHFARMPFHKETNHGIHRRKA